jgi:hypothetical protein
MLHCFSTTEDPGYYSAKISGNGTEYLETWLKFMTFGFLRVVTVKVYIFWNVMDARKL